MIGFLVLQGYVSRKTRRIVFRGFLFISTVMTIWFLWVFLSTDTYAGVPKFTHQEVKLSKPFLIHPHLNCNQQSPTGTVITVISKASNSLQRETIRRTWGHLDMQTKYNFKLYFLLGTDNNVNLDSESQLNGDIVQADIVESFYHLTEKTIEAFKWMTLFCHNASFFFKTDDDVFFDLEFLTEIQNNVKYLTDDVILGHCKFNTPASRDETKYGVSYDEYPFRYYPPYCGGPGYIMTLNTAHKIYAEMLTTRSFKFEDVYLGMVAYRLGLSVKNVKYFVHLMDKNGKMQEFYVRCSRVTHNLTPEDIQQLWDKRDNQDRDRHDCT